MLFSFSFSFLVYPPGKGVLFEEEARWYRGHAMEKGSAKKELAC